MVPPPGPHVLVEFLRQLQRILSDGSFVATYKYALLHALADLAVTEGEDSGAELTLSTRQIAEQIIELYWRQALPFPALAVPEPVELRQNTGRQAAIVTVLRQAQLQHGSSLARVRRSDAWPGLVSEVDRVVRTMPLWKLQTVGVERLSFLYENLDCGGMITLKPGVQYCLRAFYPLILDLVRGAWLRFVRNQNAGVLGEHAELGGFLFGTGRVSLAVYVPILQELQRGNCFYCGRMVRADVDVDHFIPWARYPVDLSHNFVLAHSTCTGPSPTIWQPSATWRGGCRGTRRRPACFRVRLTRRGCCTTGVRRGMSRGGPMVRRRGWPGWCGSGGASCGSCIQSGGQTSDLKAAGVSLKSPCDPLRRAFRIEQVINNIQFERTFPRGMRGTPPHLDAPSAWMGVP
jgi:hypothetical protein